MRYEPTKAAGPGQPPVYHGRDHPRHNGGLSRGDGGRMVIVCRDGSLIFFYRAVMAAQIRRLLTPQELVHHVNEDPTDDRPENLQIVTRAEHIALHRKDLEAAKTPMTHCRRGHPFTPENTYRGPRGDGPRVCKTCRRMRDRIYRAR